MKLRFLFAIFAIVLMLMFGAVACGGGGDDDGGSPAGSGQDGGDDSGDDGGDDGSTEGPTPTIPPNLGEELTIEEYFTTIDAIFEEADSATDEAQADLDAALASEEDLDAQIAAIQGYLDTELEVFSDAIGRLDVLNPPDELEADHDDFIQAVTDAASAASDLQFALDGVDNEDDANQLIDDFETDVTAITARSDAACENLQSFADANSISVDLDCED